MVWPNNILERRRQKENVPQNRAGPGLGYTGLGGLKTTNRDQERNRTNRSIKTSNKKTPYTVIPSTTWGG